MTREELIRNLKYTMKKHENDKVDTFCTNISLMCKDVLNYLEQEPCRDVISRHEVFEQIKCWISNGEYRYTNATDYLRKRINTLSSVTSYLKMGRWLSIENEEMETVGYFCSECDLPMETEEQTNYCPNCGAKMKRRNKK